MSRFDAITRAFLHYLYADDHFRPPVGNFLRSPRARIGGIAVTEAELGEVLAVLRRHELIATSGVETRAGMPAHAGLTGSGLLCVNEHDGDVGSWAGGGAVLTAEAASGAEQSGVGDGQIVEPRRSPERTTPAHPLAGLVRVARVLLLTLPAVRAVDDESEDGVQRTASRLLQAAHEPDPDLLQVRALAQRLRTELTTGPAASTLGVVLLDSLDEALHESQLEAPE